MPPSPLEGFEAPPKVESLLDMTRFIKQPDFARLHLHEALDMPGIMRASCELFQLPPDTHFGYTDFASQTREDADLEHLEALDYLALLDARHSVDPRFLYIPHPGRSGCLWPSREVGWKATRESPFHQEAIRHMDEMYEWYQVVVREIWLTPDLSGFEEVIFRNSSSDGFEHVPV